MSTVKTFKYVGNPSSGQMEPGFKNDITPKSKGGQHRNSGRHDTPSRMQQRNAQQSRNPPPRKNSKKQIRVSDGEKCVPPAKSKAKQRRNLGDTDLGYDLNMDNVRWSPDSFTVKNIIQTYGSNFPALLKITKEYARDENRDFLEGQVIQVHAFSQQDRVLVKDEASTTFSIPLDFDMTVELTKQDKSIEIMSLEAAVRKSHLPVTMYVRSIGDTVRSHDIDLTGCYVTVTAAVEDLYLRASTINDGWINQCTVAVIPEFLGMEFSIAHGVAGATENEWKDFQNMFNRTVRLMHKEDVPGFPGIVTLDNNSVAMSGFKPLTFEELDVLTSMSDISSSTNKLNGHTSPPRRAGHTMDKNSVSKDDENLYQNIGTSGSLSGSWQRDEGTGSHSWKSASTGTLDIKKTPQKSTPPPTITEEQRRPPAVNRDSKPRPPSAEYQNVVVHRTASGVVNPAYTHDGRSSTLQEHKAHSGVRLSRAASIGSAQPSRHSELEATELFDNVINGLSSPNSPEIPDRRGNQAYASARESRSPPHQNETSFIKQQHNNGAVRGNVSDIWYERQQQVKKQDSSPPPVKAKPTAAPTQQQKTAIVEPMGPRVTPGSNPQSSPYRVSINITNPDKSQVQLIHNQPHKSLTTIEDIPEDTDKLTVEQLCDCLTLLSMNVHITKFREKQIDGALLSGIKESILISEFGFTDFQASKLMRFMRGWRPKLV